MYRNDDEIKISLDPEKPVVKLGTFDRTMGRLLKTNLDRLPESDAEKDLAADVFFGNFKHNPSTLEEAPPDRTVNKALLDWALADGMGGTAGNIPASLVSSAILWSALTTDKSIQQALERQKEAEEKQKEAERLEQEAIEKLTEGSSGASDEAQNGQPGQGGQVPQEVKEMLDQAKSLRQEAQAIGAEGVKDIEWASNHPIKKQAMAQAVEKAQKAGEETAESMAIWGIDPGAPTQQDVEKIMRLVKDTDMSHVTKVLGRLREVSTSTIKGHLNANTGATAKVDATKDMKRMFPVEIAKLSPYAPDIVRARKLREWRSQGLMGYVPLEEKKESGSFIFMVDESGSIGDATCAYEKAMAIAIAKSIQDEIEHGRRYELYGFDTRIVASVTSDDDWRQHLAFAGEYSGGGTRIGDALEYAIERADDMYRSGIEGTDIVLISDGIDQVRNSIFEKLDELNSRLGVRLFYIHIGSWDWSKELEKRAYATWHIRDSRSFQKMVEELTRAVCEMVATR